MPLQTKSLKTIQRVSKFLKILCNILFVLCLIGLILCILCGAGVWALQDISYEGQTLQQSLLRETGMSVMDCVSVFAGASVYCLVYCIIYRKAIKYLKMEIADGTPFTLAGAKQLKALGWLTILLPILAGFAIAFCFYWFNFNADNLDVLISSDIVTGIILLFASVVFKYGAEVEAERSSAAEADAAGAPVQPLPYDAADEPAAEPADSETVIQDDEFVPQTDGSESQEPDEFSLPDDDGPLFEDEPAAGPAAEDVAETAEEASAEATAEASDEPVFRSEFVDDTVVFRNNKTE